MAKQSRISSGGRSANAKHTRSLFVHLAARSSLVLNNDNHQQSQHKLLPPTLTNMDGLDASAHYTQGPDDDKPSLLVLILDTNPYAWSKLHPTLPLPRALASILLFLNAHLAFSHANRVAVIASHTKEAVFLYPSTTPVPPTDNDPMRDANKYRQFRIVEDEVQASFRNLMASTTADMLAGTNETMMAGALSLALAYINRLCMPAEDVQGGHTGGNRTANGARDVDMTSMNARILVLSVSGDLSTQYVSMMNSIFAAQRKKIPIDICKIAGETVFLQQASDATRGIYMQLQHPESLLQYLMMCFIPDNSTRKHLVPPTQINVDFRAACFCHKRIVDIGFVCSICLSSQCPISSFLEGDAAIIQRHKLHSWKLAQHNKGDKPQESTIEGYGGSSESSGSLIEDTNPNTTLLVDWWLDGVRPGPDNRLKEVGSTEKA